MPDLLEFNLIILTNVEGEVLLMGPRSSPMLETCQSGPTMSQNAVGMSIDTPLCMF